jgi:hypothetical protein
VVIRVWFYLLAGFLCECELCDRRKLNFGCVVRNYLWVIDRQLTDDRC